MQQSRSLTFGFGVLGAAVLGILISQGALNETLFALMAFIGIGLFWLFSHNRTELAPVLLLFGIFFVDSPGGVAFYDWPTFTKPLGELILSATNKVFGAGVSLSLFELLSLGIAGWLAAQRLHTEKWASYLPRTVTFVALILPGAAAFGVLQGVLRGNELSSALTQVHSFFTLPIWFFIGWSLGRTLRPSFSALTAITIAMFFKALQGLYYYFEVIHSEMGRREYIVEHMTSDFILTAVLFLIALSLWFYKSGWKRLAILLPIIPFSIAHALNARRSSMVGLAFSMGFMLFAMPRGWLRRAMPTILIVAGILTLFVLATWEVSGPLGLAAHTVKSIIFDAKESSRDYRVAENANLYYALSQNILLGLGLGTRFQLVYHMDDISSLYANFNLIPHNTLLFLWAFIGPVGIAAFAAFITINIAMLTRTLRRDRRDFEWILAWLAFTMVIRWAVFVYADIGLMDVRSLALLGMILGTLWRRAPRYSLPSAPNFTSMSAEI